VAALKKKMRSSRAARCLPQEERRGTYGEKEEWKKTRDGKGRTRADFGVSPKKKEQNYSEGRKASRGDEKRGEGRMSLITKEFTLSL